MDIENDQIKEHVRVIVAVGDISGFGAWFNSVSDVNVELKPFFKKYDTIIDELRTCPDSFFKDLGDGFVIIKELNGDHACKKVICLLNKLWKIKKKVRMLINSTPYPRPDGFRIRIACGHVWKKSHKAKTDYLGKHINLAFKLLQVHKNRPIIVHESVPALMSEKQVKENKFDFKKLPLPTDHFEDIYRFEMDHLWSFETRYGNRKRDRKTCS